MEKFPGGTYVPAGTLTCGEVLRFHGKDDDKTKRRKSVRLEKSELDLTEEEERKFERKERRQSLTRFHPDFPKISQESLEEERRLERKERRASARYEVDVMKKVQENEEEERKLERKERRASARLNPDVIMLENERREEEERKLERKERRASARLNPDVIMLENERREEEERKLERKERRASARLNPDVIMLENERRDEEERKLERKERRASARYEIETLKKIQENEEEERKLERKERRASARLNPDIIKTLENGKSEEERKFERRQSATRFHPDIQKINQENEKRNGQDGDLKKKWKNNREEVMKNLQIFMQGVEETENEYQEDLRDDMSQSEADSIPPAQAKKKTVLSNGKVIDPSIRIKKELEATGTGSDFTGGKNVGNSRERLALEREKERERMAQEKEKQKVMLEKERERVMTQERARQRAMHDKEKERMKIGQERERERALQERERLMHERERVLQDKEKILISSNEQNSALRVSPKDLKIDTGYHSTTSYNGGSDRERGYGSGKMSGVDVYGRPRPALVPSASPSPSQNRRVQGSFSESLSGMGPNRTPRGSFLETGGGTGGFYGALPVTSPIVLVDGPFFLSADPPTSSYATHRPLGGSFMAGSLRSTPNSKTDRSRQSFASINSGGRNPSHNASFSNIYEKEAARRQNTSRLDEDRAVDLNLSYDNIYSRDHDDSSSDSETRSGENFNSPRNRPDEIMNKLKKQEVKKEAHVGNKRSEKSEKSDMSKSFRHEDEFFTEAIAPTNVRDPNDSSSVSTVSHSKYGENASESDVTSFSAPNYKFPPKKYDFKKR